MRVIRRTQIKDWVGLHPDWCTKLSQRGQFPPRVKLGPRAVGWLEDDVRQWLAERREDVGSRISGVDRPSRDLRPNPHISPRVVHRAYYTTPSK